ncbi:recombinase RecA [Candidatus Peregrinibacteria bacterium]|nr:recombinase RecA [Candidatus Peregrinibacteria bacterium]
MVLQEGAKVDKKLEALKNAIVQIEKQYGRGAIMRLGTDTKLDVEGLTTGSLSLDIATGGSGVPRGRVVEIFGPESSGKTTLCLTIIANVQKAGGEAAFIDAEHALDPAYAKKIGVDLDKLLLSQPDSGEQALEIAEILVRSNAVDLIVIDSVAALVPKAELEGQMGDQIIGLQARLMSQALRKLSGTISKSKTCAIFINQLRDKIGGFAFGPSETTSGGRALKFYASMRIDLRRVQTLKEGETAYGNRVKANIVKNKIAPPFKKAEFDLLFDSGISYEGDLIDLGVEAGVIDKSGTWLAYKAHKIGQGKEKAREFLKENKDVAKQLELEVKKHFGVIVEEEKKKAEAEPEKVEAKA